MQKLTSPALILNCIIENTLTMFFIINVRGNLSDVCRMCTKKCNITYRCDKRTRDSVPVKFNLLREATMFIMQWKTFDDHCTRCEITHSSSLFFQIDTSACGMCVSYRHISKNVSCLITWNLPPLFYAEQFFFLFSVFCFFFHSRYMKFM